MPPKSARSRASVLSVSSASSRAQTPTASTSKAAVLPARNAVQDPTGRIKEFASENDKCPVCKSDRYLNPHLRLLVSKCYHKMCESCIDRIFTLGPEPCPTPGCGVELRKTGFTAQTFEDLRVEKEVTIRKRISKCFNKRPEDFADLRAYNDYLEEVEDISKRPCWLANGVKCARSMLNFSPAFNLINSVDVPATEERIKAYQRANAALIATNSRIANDESKLQLTQDARELTQRNARRQAAQEMEAAAARERNQGEMTLIEMLGRTKDDKEASGLFKKARRQAAQKRKEAEIVPEEWARLMGPSVASMDVDGDQANFSLLDDPSMGRAHWYDYRDMYALPSTGEVYAVDPWSTFPTSEEEIGRRAIVGGFDRPAFWERCIRSAVQGIFVEPVAFKDGQTLMVA